MTELKGADHLTVLHYTKNIGNIQIYIKTL